MKKNISALYGSITIIMLLIVLLAACTTPTDDNPRKDPEKPVERQILVNQVGYIPAAQKYFFTDKPAKSFKIISTADDSIVFTGTITSYVDDDAATGMNTYIGDFTSFTEPGRYYIDIKGQAVSYPFTIEETVFNTVTKKSIKSLYFQRCGDELTEQFAGQFARTTCHMTTCVFHESTGLTGEVDMSGGWHDAGDYGKYIGPGSVSLAIMLIGYEQFPDKFAFDDNMIPESNNGIPDFLDELRYELEWMFKMQDDESGALYYMVNTLDYTWDVPESDTATQYIYQTSSVATADFAAVMAQASRIYEAYDPDFARLCLQASEAAWAYLEANPDLVPAGGYQNPDDTDTGGYGMSPDRDDRPERLWAAVELYRTTEESKYRTYIQENMVNYSRFYNDISWLDVMALAKLEYLLADPAIVDSTVYDSLKTAFLNRCDDIIRSINRDGLKVALSVNDYYWGSNGVLMSLAMYLVLGHTMSGNQDYYNGALSQLNYILGINAHNMSFVTKLGSVYPNHIHHAAMINDYINDSYPGILTGGPNRYIEDDWLLREMFDASTPPALCYIDDNESYGSNENCIFYNAPLIVVASYFSDFTK